MVPRLRGRARAGAYACPEAAGKPNVSPRPAGISTMGGSRRRFATAFTEVMHRAHLRPWRMLTVAASARRSSSLVMKA